MTKKSSTAGGKPLVIVESPAKARTIGKFLGRGYTIEASIGHIRDLPQGAKEIPERYKKEKWAYLGVDVEHDFEPVYVIPHAKSRQVRKLKDLLKNASELYLATDEDREGEAISWHLCEVLKPRVPVRRLVFHEITEEAIRDALKNPRQIDDNLVRAQEVRRIVDRLYGYDVSPLLWRKIRPRLSAGRVQSVAVRLIVERERQRMAFRAATYWDLIGTFANAAGQSFEAELIEVAGRRIPEGRDFDPATGKLKEQDSQGGDGSRLLQLDESAAAALLERLRTAPCRVASLEVKPYTTRPYPPFTTSTLQQEANRKYGFTAQHTMQVAQSLYENGYITYMRTDSTTLASVAIEAARRLVASQYGREYLPSSPRIYLTKVKNAQEAHEAIRPAGHHFEFPESLRPRLSPDEFRLYDLIWKRTIASQMSDARGHRVAIGVEVGGDFPEGAAGGLAGSAENTVGQADRERSAPALFQAVGRTIEFPGYLRAYVEGSDDPEADLADREAVLPQVAVGESLRCVAMEPKSHTTQPPNRYSEAALTRALEEMGIGRPSTYASIIDTILAREYVFKPPRGNVLVPTWTAFAVSQLLETHLPDLVDYQFTAEMEDELDAISRGEMDHRDYLRMFYYGNEHPGLKQLLENKLGEIDARDVCSISLGKPKDSGERAEEIFLRVGRYGPYLQQGERRASLPDRLPPDELTIEAALELLDKAVVGDEPLGYCPETHKPVFIKQGRFGPYVQRGTAADDEKPQNASLLKGMSPECVDLETALRLLALPRTLGPHPQTGEPVIAHNGRYGPYVKCGTETRSMPAELSPLDITLEQALALLAQPKTRRGAAARAKEPLKTFDVSPVTGQPVRLLQGRYGPYVTDGVTNASLPRTTPVEEATFEQALELLQARAASAPPKKAARKKTAAKKTAAKKTAAKKTAAKKSSTSEKPSAKRSHTRTRA